ncbi:helix-turn-helix domain-containing protein [Aquibacillus sediminis]|uniref:helix-turn-helix domain-containing protein n=1 Tax=Aquibacillus sediminis TaxID=2574734 RepID=UPI0011087004|nr:helix-turn-helix domain-containing protein [Aquibacillus sediminis]
MTTSKKHQRYSKEIKLKAVRRVLENDEPVNVVVKELGIRNRDNVYEWIKKYRKNGESGFDRSIGRPKKEEISKSTDERVDQLRVEVDALKKYLEILHQGGHK